MRIDFSNFHPLDHGVWARRCADLPGGRRRHISLQWEFKTGAAIRRATTCKMGRHHYVGWWRKSPEKTIPRYLCEYCFRERK